VKGTSKKEKGKGKRGEVKGGKNTHTFLHPEPELK